MPRKEGNDWFWSPRERLEAVAYGTLLVGLDFAVAWLVGSTLVGKAICLLLGLAVLHFAWVALIGRASDE